MITVAAACYKSHILLWTSYKSHLAHEFLAVEGEAVSLPEALAPPGHHELGHLHDGLLHVVAHLVGVLRRLMTVMREFCRGFWAIMLCVFSTDFSHFPAINNIGVKLPQQCPSLGMGYVACLREQVPQRPLVLLQSLVLDPEDGDGRGEREDEADEDPLGGCVGQPDDPGGGCIDGVGNGHGHLNVVVVAVDASTAFLEIWNVSHSSVIMHTRMKSFGSHLITNLNGLQPTQHF